MSKKESLFADRPTQGSIVLRRGAAGWITSWSRSTTTTTFPGGDRGGSDVRVDQQLSVGREQGDDGDRGDEHTHATSPEFLLALRLQLQRWVPDGGVQHRDGGSSAGDGATVCGPLCPRAGAPPRRRPTSYSLRPWEVSVRLYKAFHKQPWEESQYQVVVFLTFE